MKKTFKLFLLFAFSTAYCLLPTACFSAGTTAADFLAIGVGARACAMGEAYSAVADGASSVYWNPAGLGATTGSEVTFSHLQYVSGIRLGDAAFCMPCKSGVMGAELNTLYTEDTARDTSGNKTGDFMNYNAALTLAYSQEVGKNIYLGAGIKGIYLKLDDTAAKGAGLDLGGLYKVNEKLKFALAVQDIGTKIKFDNDFAAPLGTNVRAGMCYSINSNWIAALDGNIPFDGGDSVSIGSEYYITKFLPIRIGYKYRSGGNDLGGLDGLSAGLGIIFRAIHELPLQLDYAFVPFGEFGATHRVSFGVKW